MSTTKNTKFSAGHFLEIDDLNGGKKVVMVCKDGVTFWDSMKSDKTTPVVIHAAMNPVEIGTFVGYIETKQMRVVTQNLISHLRLKTDDRVETDPLFMMRVVWFLASKNVSDSNVPQAALFDEACELADKQEAVALSQQRYAEEFYKVAE